VPAAACGRAFGAWARQDAEGAGAGHEPGALAPAFCDALGAREGTRGPGGSRPLRDQLPEDCPRSLTELGFFLLASGSDAMAAP
jgi:hypothetical protein